MSSRSISVRRASSSDAVTPGRWCPPRTARSVLRHGRARSHRNAPGEAALPSDLEFARGYFHQDCHLALYAPKLGTIGTIKGVVYEEADHAHVLAGASVTLADATELTDDSGHYGLDGIPGAATIVVKLPGYAPASVPVTVPMGASSTVDIGLSRPSAHASVRAVTIDPTSDFDGDGVPDAQDNCSEVANPISSTPMPTATAMPATATTMAMGSPTKTTTARSLPIQIKQTSMATASAIAARPPVVAARGPARRHSPRCFRLPSRCSRVADGKKPRRCDRSGSVLLDPESRNRARADDSRYGISPQ